LVYLAAAAVSLPAGMLVATSEEGVSVGLMALAALGGLVIVANIPVALLFGGWLFLAPIFQVAAEENPIGLVGVWALYTMPALLFVVMTVPRLGSAHLSWIDVFPGAYAFVVLGSLVLTNDEFHTRTTGALKYYVLTVGLGAIVYYFLTLGPGRRITSEFVTWVLLWGAAVQGVLGIVEYVTLWSLWPSTGWQDFTGEPGRITATLVNPAVLGTYLGVAVVFAVAILAFGGPRSLRRPSIAVLAFGTPALLFAYTRAPILATLAAVTVILVASRLRLIAAVVAASAAMAIFALLPAIQQSSLYEQRFSDTRNILARSHLQDWSLKLWEQKPVVGHGWGSFDRVKNESGFVARGFPTWIVYYYTSHNTYLTILVETGLIGLVLYGLPFIVLGIQGFARSRLPGPDRWLLIGALGGLGVIAFTAASVDFRFFSVVQMLPFLLLALLRRVTSERPVGA
jgi:O-antigen ligase